jgi:hypothetical protein
VSQALVRRNDDDDLVKRANGQILEGGADWQRVRTHLNPSKPLELVIERAGRTFTALCR